MAVKGGLGGWVGGLYTFVGQFNTDCTHFPINMTATHPWIHNLQIEHGSGRVRGARAPGAPLSPLPMLLAPTWQCTCYPIIFTTCSLSRFVKFLRIYLTQ